MQWKKGFGRLYCILLASAIIYSLTACGRGEETQKTDAGAAQEKIIAILGWDEYVEGNQDFINGMDMALEELGESVLLKKEYYNDGGSYDEGLLMAQGLANDDRVAAVFSFQDFEVIEAEAHYFEEAEKPLVAVQGCYEKTLERGLEYVFSSYVSSKDMGAAAAKYCAGKGIVRAACSHTDTTFEKDEVKGFCTEAEAEGIVVADLQSGPDSWNELEQAYRRWNNLGIRALFLCQYTETEAEKDWIFQVIRYIRERDPKFLILGDYSLDGPEYLQKYGKYMEGITYPRPYSVTETGRIVEFRQRYAQKYPDMAPAGDGACQGYDMTQMAGKALQGRDGTDKKNSQKDGTLIRDFFKSDTGYNGVSGKISYSGEGKIQSAAAYYCVHDSVFVTEGSYE